MGILDKIPFMGDNEDKKQNEAEKREQDFVKTRDLFQAGTLDNEADIYERVTRNDLLRWQQELDDELFSLVQSLLGKQRNEDGWETVSPPLCNLKFIHEVIIPQCRPFMSRNMINTHYDERRILMDLKSTHRDIIDVMADNWDKYDIDFANFDLILRLIKNTNNPGPYRALKGWTKKIDSSTIKRIESLQEQQEQKKKTIWSVTK